MLRIAPRALAPGSFDDAQAILVTSAAAAPFLAAAGARSDTRILAVGNAAAAAAKSAGFASVESADGDVHALAALAIAGLDPTAGPIIHAAGARRAGDLAGMLGRAGFDARLAVLYDAVEASEISPPARQALADGEIDYAAFFSPQTARTFVRLCEVAGLSGGLDCVTAVALSQNVARPLADLKWRRLLTAERPTATALLTVLSASAFGATLGNGTGQAT